MKNFGLYILVALGVVGYNYVTEADRDGQGVIVSGGSVDAFNMRIGDCFDDTSSSFGDEATEIESLPGVPCASPHDNEVYAVFDVGISSYSSDEEMSYLAFDSCMERFKKFVGRDYESSDLDIKTLYPTKDSWNTLNDREVVCAIYDMNESKLVGSVAGQGL